MTEKEKDISTELEAYKAKGANLLMPSTHIAGLSEYHHPIIETVKLSSNPNDGDVYPHDNAAIGPEKKWRPTKQALMKLSVCSGVIWSPSETKRTDNGQSRDYISYKAVGGIKKADGQPVFFSAEYDIDFEVMRDELVDQYTKKAEAKDKQGNYYRKTAEERAEYVDFCVNRDMIQKRKFKLRLCEAGAMNRVLRMLLGLKQAYTTKELEQPFVMARIVFRPDFSDAAVRKQFVDASIKAMTGIYGPQALDQEIRDSKPIDITPLPEEESGTGPEPPQAEEKKPEEPANIDFEKLDAAKQSSTIFTLSVKKGYDVKGYLGRAQKEKLSDLTPEQRTKLYRHLLSIPDEPPC
ncbi:MAG: hypothetical protein LLG40_10025 [Deltaproteobacteria bacterium]|nr:hypothetical protein [Deltaproteobacteria bacterium]